MAKERGRAAEEAEEDEGVEEDGEATGKSGKNDAQAKKDAASKIAAEAHLSKARLDMARPIIRKPIPPAPAEALVKDANGNDLTTIVLFYQYVEPPWTKTQHRKALHFVQQLGRQHGVTGRGRCAQEGLNCTLTGSALGVRAFCQGLRDWNPLFEETDFKFTDALEHNKRFKALTVRKVDELVAYGLEGAYAPSLARNAAVNLEADDYHKMMADSDAVIIDVRNVYESAIGHFQPPEKGAELIIPPVRHSFEFPRWFNMPETKEKLKGKKVMMYCTGGIRCERATALLDQIEKVSGEEFQTQGIFHCRGGIERYMRTFPEGGFWKGKNYLFDRRLEQVPELKKEEDLQRDVESWCSVCRKPWGMYRGAKTCAVQECKIPVIVCDDCQNADPQTMKCPMCSSGEKFHLRSLSPPRLVNLENATRKRKHSGAEEMLTAAERAAAAAAQAKAKRTKHESKEPDKRLFVGKLPLVTDIDAIGQALGTRVKRIQWLVDHETRFFYGSAFVLVRSLDDAVRAVERASKPGIKLGPRRLRVNFAPLREGDVWPPEGHVHLERPPLPPC